MHEINDTVSIVWVKQLNIKPNQQLAVQREKKLLKIENRKGKEKEQNKTINKWYLAVSNKWLQFFIFLSHETCLISFMWDVVGKIMR